MNAVWLSDELLVTPSAVAGLVCGVDDDLYLGWWTHAVFVDVVLLGGARLRAWVSETERLQGVSFPDVDGATLPGRARAKAAAEAEVARLSELLWPAPRVLVPAVQCAEVHESRGRCIRDAGHRSDHEFK